ncbi:uncharacterized protein LOC122665417 [Telopea speciosissima]|uniref:uncharacterized protein LOC122665417 n=1 Tax=Telopea speciosissima TaxID=54955 RepID=UPI001CC4A81A|nr:uncharacterized protein LOC122665417 [Telopea speciosissima]
MNLPEPEWPYAGHFPPPPNEGQAEVRPRLVVVEQANQVLVNQEDLIRLIQEQTNPLFQPITQPVYRKLYPEYYDQLDFGYTQKIPLFAKFSGEDNMSTVEHIARFIAQCGTLGANEIMKLRLFPNSLTGSAFTWYINLPADSIQTWREMEDQFHAQFYRIDPLVSIADLACMCQLPDESAAKFVNRFKLARYKCPTVLQEPEYAKMALGRLSFELRKRFVGQELPDLGQLIAHATSYELVLKEEEDQKASSSGTYYKQSALAIMGATTPSTSPVNFSNFKVDEECEVSIAEIVSGKPCVCKALSPMVEHTGSSPKPKPTPARNLDSRARYSYNISKAESIFDHLLKDKQIKLLEGHQIPSAEEIKGKRYCKWHNSFTHNTNGCIVLRMALQQAINDGCLKFPNKGKGIMLVDENPFLPINMVDADLSKLRLLKRKEPLVTLKHLQHLSEEKKKGVDPEAIEPPPGQCLQWGGLCTLQKTVREQAPGGVECSTIG